MDELPALSGIVLYFWDAMQGSYLTGLWKKQLLHELSWMAPETTSRSEVWRSPLWSYVCLNRAVAFQADQCGWFEPAMKILSCEVIPAIPSAPF